MMKHYSSEIRESVLRRILPPNSEKMSDVSKDTGIPIQTISSWKLRATKNSIDIENDDDSSDLTSEQKFDIVIATAALNETELGEYARSKGLFVAQIQKWRLICSKANANFSQECKRFKNLLKEKEERLQLIQQDLEKKNTALAEMSAELILAKKCWAIWGERKAE